MCADARRKDSNGQRSPNSRPYLESKKQASALRNEGIPKGLMGYTSTGRPAFSTREIASLWMLQRLVSLPDGPRGNGWHGRALIREIREATRLTIPATGEEYPGYMISDGVCFGLLNEWLDAGVVEVADTKPVGFGKTQVNYRITEEGKRFYEQLRRSLHIYVAGASLLLNRLHADVYGSDVWSTPVRADEGGYTAAVDESMPLPKRGS